jgi:hypothetical protein
MDIAVGERLSGHIALGRVLPSVLRPFSHEKMEEDRSVAVTFRTCPTLKNFLNQDVE